jgi:WD40 repeat protein
MLDGDGVRVVLIGTGIHARGSSLPDVPQVAGTLSTLGQCLTSWCGLAAEHLAVVRDPGAPQEIRSAVAAAAAEANDMLVIYYTGHGVLSSGSGTLHLASSAFTNPSPDALEDQALPFRRLVETVTEHCRARAVVVILDCCFSGRASVPGHDWTVLMSAGGSEHALVPAGRSYPAYTGELIHVLTHGDPRSPPELTLQHVHEYLVGVSERGEMPRPRASFGAGSARLVVTRNRAYETQHDESPGPVYENICPYRGLDSYSSGDERFFFGREALRDIVIRRMADRLWAGGPVFVIGASGSGKSSLLACGVLPGIGRGGFGIPGSSGWPQVAFTPGADPAGVFAQALADVSGIPSAELRSGLGGDPDTIRDVVRGCLTTAYGWSPGVPEEEPRLIVVVDQAEELFTVCQDDAARHMFLGAVAAITERSGSRLPLGTVAFGLRSEFFTQCADFPELGNAAEPDPIRVGSMTSGELRAAITRPAEAIGLLLEGGLADLLIQDIGADPGDDSSAGYDPGALPALSYALLGTWQRKAGARLTVAGYRAVGGVHDALRIAADEAFAELSGSPGAQDAMHELLLQLVSIGRDRPDTRRRVRRMDLLDGSADPAGTEQALSALVTRRLVTADGDWVQITHEALIRRWPVLQAWIDQDRDRVLAQQELVEQAARWEDAAHARSFLYRGEQLLGIRARLGGAAASRLRGPAAKFLAASMEQERRRKLSRRAYVGLVVVIAIVASALAVVANQDSHTASSDLTLAVARELVADTDTLEGTEPGLARQLLAQAYQMSDTPLTEGGLLTSLAIPGVVATSSPATVVAYGGNGSWLAIATTKTVLLADPATGSVLDYIRYSNPSIIDDIAVSPDGHLLAVSAGDQVDLWMVTDPRHPVHLRTIPQDAPSAALAFSPDGLILATSRQLSFFHPSSQIELWDMARPARPVGMATLPGSHIDAMAFSPDGRTLAAAAARTTLWEVSSADTLTSAGQLPAATIYPNAVAFAPSGHLLAIGSIGGPASLWDISDPKRPVLTASLTGVTDVEGVAFSPDARTLATASAGSIVLWDVAAPTTPVTLTTLDAAAGASTAAFSPDGHALATAGTGTGVDLWNTPEPPALSSIAGGGGFSAYAAIAAGSRLLAFGNTSGASLWDITDPQAPRFLGTVTNPEVTTGPGTPVASLLERALLTSAVAFDPARPLLALAGGTDVSLWNLTDPGHPVHVKTITTPVNADLVIFSSRGHYLAIADRQQITVWDVTDPARPVLVKRTQAITAGAMAFSPNGQTIAYASSTGSFLSSSTEIHLWNVTGASKPVLLPLPACTGSCLVSSLAFSPDGQTLVAGTSSGVFLLSIGDHRADAAQQVDTLPTQISALAFSPDGSFLAIGVGADTYIWATSTLSAPVQVTILRAPALGEQVDALTFSQNGRTLVTGYDNATISIWDTDLADLAQRLCRDTGPVITQSEWDQFLPGLSYSPPCKSPS